MGCAERIFRKVILFWCLLKCCGADNICERMNQYMYCSCDFEEPHDKTERMDCFVFGNVTADHPIWDSFSLKPNLLSLTFHSRTGSELRFVPAETLQTLEKLTTIVFRGSKLGVLESYSFSKLANVTTISLTGNDITELKERCFYRMHNLNQIELSENRLKRVPPNAFVDLPALQKLFLDRNSISRLEANAFRSLRNLKQLDLQLNEIKKVGHGSFAGLGQLVLLDLFKNKIETIEAGIFSPLTKLQELDVSDNSVYSIEVGAFRGLDSLVTLRLVKNKITRLPPGLFSDTPQLLHADLSNNKIHRLSGATIEELKNRLEGQFVIRFEGNDLICDCELWWWTAEYLETSASSEWKKHLRNIKCRFPEGDDTAYRVSNLQAAQIGCLESRPSTKTPLDESSTGIVIDKIPLSESSSSQKDVPKVGDESQEVHLEGHMDDSDDTSLKQDSLVTKGSVSVEVQQGSPKSDKNSANYKYADVLAMMFSLFLILCHSL